MDKHAMIATHLRQLCDARDRYGPGSPEEAQACVALLARFSAAEDREGRGPHARLAQIPPDLVRQLLRNDSSIFNSRANPLTSARDGGACPLHSRMGWWTSILSFVRKILELSELFGAGGTDVGGKQVWLGLGHGGSIVRRKKASTTP